MRPGPEVTPPAGRAQDTCRRGFTPKTDTKRCSSSAGQAATSLEKRNGSRPFFRLTVREEGDTEIRKGKVRSRQIKAGDAKARLIFGSEDS